MNELTPRIPARPSSANGLWLVDKSKYAILPVPFPIPDKKTEVLLKMEVSGISRGTERLVFHNQVPESLYDRMQAPFQKGSFPFPVQYGYCAVARVIDGPATLLDRLAFCLYPHQDYFTASADHLTLIPDKIPADRAILAANMETALNAVWDSGVTAGDHVSIIGGGVIGFLIGSLVRSIPAVKVTMVDVMDRSELAHQFSLHFETEPEKALNADVVFHCSAQEAGLQTALKCAGEEARVIEMSWYGTKPVNIPLGEAFHAKRLQLISSQVGGLPASHHKRWSFRRRMQTVMTLLDNPLLDHLLTHTISFDQAPTRLPPLFDAPDVLAISLHYERTV